MSNLRWFVAFVFLSYAVTVQAVCPLVIAHRGASGDRPEHTLPAYQLAIEQGADFIEVDLVPTRDGVLIARHENALALVALQPDGTITRIDGAPVVTEATTNVATKPEFSDRLTVKVIDGRPMGGWFSEDFTIAEIKSLRARERMPGVRPANTAYDDMFEVPTFAQVLELAKAGTTGVYPELKHYTYFMNEALSLTGEPIRNDTLLLLIRDLLAADFEDPARLFIQSFEVEPLLRLRILASAGEAPPWPRVQLTGPPDGIPYDLLARAKSGTLDGLSELFAGYGGAPRAMTYGDLLAEPDRLRMSHADVVGPAYQALLADPELGARLQKAGLLIHAYTLRQEAVFLPPQMSLTALSAELRRLGVNGVFTDNVPQLRGTLADCQDD